MWFQSDTLLSQSFFGQTRFKTLEIDSERLFSSRLYISRPLSFLIVHSRPLSTTKVLAA